MASKYREQKIIATVPCPACGAGIGELCRRIPGHLPARPMLCAARRTEWQFRRQVSARGPIEGSSEAVFSPIASSASTRGKIIAWLSRHPPLDSQRAELLRIFGPHELRQDISTFQRTPEGATVEILRRLIELGATECVIVAPLTLMAQLTERGVRPLRAVMELVPDGDPRTEVTEHGRSYRFVRFERVLRVTVETEKL